MEWNWQGAIERQLGIRSILILGFGVEGQRTYRFLRSQCPRRMIGIADERPMARWSDDVRRILADDANVRLHTGGHHKQVLRDYELVFRTPGIPACDSAFEAARQAGVVITSHTQLFLSLARDRTIGVTGTKGKGTTCRLIHGILRQAGFESHLVGNIGHIEADSSPLEQLTASGPSSWFVYELSSFQLEDASASPHIAVLLDIVPEHLDHHGSFERYVSSKENITRNQSGADWLVYNAACPVPAEIARRSRARHMPFAASGICPSGFFLRSGEVVDASGGSEVAVADVDRIRSVLPEEFNLNNILAAVAVAQVLDVSSRDIEAGIQTFRPLPHRFDRLGMYRGITFVNAAIATVPEVTIAHLDELGSQVETVLLGGYDRGQDYSRLAERLLRGHIRTVILFPDSGIRIWRAVQAAAGGSTALPDHFFVEDMERAVGLAYERTRAGGICLHSPASASRGGPHFRDYAERGERFTECVRRLGTG